MIIKIILAILLVFNSFTVNINLADNFITVYAATKKQPNCEQESDDEWRHIWQGDPRWGNIGPATIGWSASDTVGAVGCCMCSNMMLMAYDNPELRDFNVFNPYIMTMGCDDAGNPIVEPKWAADWIYPGSETYGLPGNAAWKMYQKVSTSGMSIEQKAQAIKGYMDEGSYCVLYVTGPHYVACTGWNEDLGIPIIQDPGGIGYDARNQSAEYNWERYAPILQEIQLKTGMRKANETLIGYSTDFSVTSSQSEALAKADADSKYYEYQGVVTLKPEYKLEGLDELDNYMIKNVDASRMDKYADPDFYAEYMAENFTDSMIQNKAALEAQITARKDAKKSNIYTYITIAGIVFLLYLLFLFLAWCFDKATGKSLFSLLTLLTFGKIHVEDSHENYYGNMNGEKTWSDKQFLLALFIASFFTLLLISGWLYKISSWLCNLFV